MPKQKKELTDFEVYFNFIIIPTIIAGISAIGFFFLFNKLLFIISSISLIFLSSCMGYLIGLLIFVLMLKRRIKNV